MSLNEKERMICEYLEGMAQKVGGDVIVRPSGKKNEYIMRNRNNPLGRNIAVSMETPREDFNRAVKWLMEV